MVLTLKLTHEKNREDKEFCKTIVCRAIKFLKKLFEQKKFSSPTRAGWDEQVQLSLNKIAFLKPVISILNQRLLKANSFIHTYKKNGGRNIIIC